MGLAKYLKFKCTRILNWHGWMRLAGCAGRGDNVCPKCNADQEPGFYKENQMTQCPTCYGRGLIARRDGSDAM